MATIHSPLRSRDALKPIGLAVASFGCDQNLPVVESRESCT